MTCCCSLCDLLQSIRETLGKNYALLCPREMKAEKMMVVDDGEISSLALSSSRNPGNVL